MRNTSLSSVLCHLSSRLASLASCLATLTLTFSSAQAEEWGFAYSGQLLQTKDGQRTPAKFAGASEYTATFYVRLYDDSEKTCVKKEALWGREIRGVPVKDGNFAFELNDSAGVRLDDTVCDSIRDAFAKLSGDRMTVGVTPFDDTRDEISPRQLLVAVPYAAFAGDARGARGGVEIGGTLTVVDMSAGSATFRDSVTHAGRVTFSESPTVPSLTVTNAFIAETVETKGTLSTGELWADELRTKEAAVELKDTPALASTGDLKVSGAVNTPSVVARDGGSVTLSDNVGSHGIRAAKVVLNGRVNLFDFDREVATIPMGSDYQSVMEWYGNSWTVPSRSQQPSGAHNYFVSLSLLVNPGEPVTVKVGTDRLDRSSQIAVTKLSVDGVTSPVWLPFQTLLKPGESISWADPASREWGSSNVLLSVRAAGF